ncbi:hypothetical protein ILUMI_18560, partial [Ignelater luminosus]
MAQPNQTSNLFLYIVAQLSSSVLNETNLNRIASGTVLKQNLKYYYSQERDLTQLYEELETSKQSHNKSVTQLVENLKNECVTAEVRRNRKENKLFEDENENIRESKDDERNDVQEENIDSKAEVDGVKDDEARPKRNTTLPLHLHDYEVNLGCLALLSSFSPLKRRENKLVGKPDDEEVISNRRVSRAKEDDERKINLQSHMWHIKQWKKLFE